MWVVERAWGGVSEFWCEFVRGCEFDSTLV